MSKQDTLVITPVAILSYPHLDAPQKPQKPTDKAKFGTVLVFPAGTDLAAMKKAAMAAATERWGDKAAGYVTVGGKGSTFRNDVMNKDGTRKYDDGAVYISAKNESQPGLVYSWPGEEKHPTTGKLLPARIPQEKIREVLYAGAVVIAQLRAFAYNHSGNEGIGWALNNIQKKADGKRLDNRQDATEAFDADLNAAPADLAALGIA